jgi:hypothetical protein
VPLVGQAAAHVGQETRDRVPGIPWRAIVAIHGCWGLTVGGRPAGPSDAASSENWVSLSTAGVLAGGGSPDGPDPVGWRSVLANGPTRYAIVETGDANRDGR